MSQEHESVTYFTLLTILWSLMCSEVQGFSKFKFTCKRSVWSTCICGILFFYLPNWTQNPTEQTQNHKLFLTKQLKMTKVVTTWRLQIFLIYPLTLQRPQKNPHTPAADTTEKHSNQTNPINKVVTKLTPDSFVSVSILLTCPASHSYKSFHINSSL